MIKKYLLLFMLLSMASIFPQNNTVKHHAFSGTLMLGAEAGTVIGFTDYPDIKPEIYGRAVLEYFFPTTSAGIFGIKAFYGAGYIGGKGLSSTTEPETFRSTLSNIGGGFSYTFSIEDKVFPFIMLGASYAWVNPKDADGNVVPPVRDFDITSVIYQGELGIRFLLAKSINLSLTAGTMFSPEDHWDGLPPVAGNDIAMYGLVGFSYSLFTESDADGDGVTDEMDKCPDTPPGVVVDDFGCPLDSDGDGVPDYKDKCPNTERGMKVDENGCVVDADGDGVSDAQDKCPNTPKGVKVNEFGCPDSDGDGVYDDRDKCPDTPQGAAVDENGCPKDSDGDGVPDYKDNCPNTPRGEQVDENGCSTKKDTVVVNITLSGDTNFEFNKSSLLPAAYPVLNNLAATMKENKTQKWRIEGHTDSKGSDSYNMELSRKRAQAVADYLTQQGADRANLEIVPLGEGQPVSTNDTPEGRAMNRRVEIKPVK